MSDDEGNAVALGAEDAVAAEEAVYGTEAARLITEVNFDPNAVDPETGNKIPYVTVGKPMHAKSKHIWANCYAYVADPDNPDDSNHPARDESGVPLSTNYMLFHAPLDFTSYEALQEQLIQCPYFQQELDFGFHQNDYIDVKLGIPTSNTTLIQKMQSFQDCSDEFMKTHMINYKARNARDATKVVKIVKGATKDAPAATASKEYNEGMMRPMYYPAGVSEKGKDFPPSFIVKCEKKISTLLVPVVDIIKKGQWVNVGDIGSKELLEDAAEEGLTIGEDIRRSLVKREWIPDGLTDIDEIRAIVNQKQYVQFNLRDLKIGDRLVLNVSDSGICCTSKCIRRGMIVVSALVFPKHVFQCTSRQAVERPKALNWLFQGSKRKNTACATDHESGGSDEHDIDNGAPLKASRFVVEGDPYDEE